MGGLNRHTGRVLSGWDHVNQSLEVLFTTYFSERVMRRWFGSLIPHMLGQNMSPNTLLKFFYSMAIAIELYEPRFKPTKLHINSANRSGFMEIRIDGIYYPDARAGDTTPGQPRSIIVAAKNSGLVVSPFEAN